MTQNRNKLLDLFIGNLSNAILHKILEDAIDNREIANKYEKDLTTSFAIAMKYRENINPLLTPLPEIDQGYVRTRISKKVRAELFLRISKGYEGITVETVEQTVDSYLREAKVT